MAANPYLPNPRGNRFVAQPNFGNTSPRPTASPVDTYVRPESNPKSEQLAQALSQLSPELAELSDVLSDRLIADQEAQAVAFAEQAAAEGKKVSDLVRKGEVPAGASPWFMAKLRETAGMNDGYAAAAALEEAMKRDPRITNATSLEEFNEYAGEFIEAWLNENGMEDSRYLAAFGRIVNAHLGTKTRPTFLKNADAKLKAQASEFTRGLIHKELTQDIPFDAPAEQKIEILERIRRGQIAVGRDPADVDLDIMEGVAEAALHPTSIDNGQVFQTLNLLEQMPSSIEGLTLGQTDTGAKFLRAKRKEAGEEIARIRKEQDRILKERRDAVIEAGTREGFRRLMQGPNADFKDIVDSIAEVDVVAAQEFMKTMKTISKDYDDLSVSDEHLYYQIRNAIWDQPQNLAQLSRQVHKYVAERRLSIEDGNDLIERIGKRREALQRLKNETDAVDIMRNRIVVDALKSVTEGIPLGDRTDGWLKRLEARAEAIDEIVRLQMETDFLNKPGAIKTIQEIIAPIIDSKRQGLSYEIGEGGLRVNPAREPMVTPKKTESGTSSEAEDASPSKQAAVEKAQAGKPPLTASEINAKYKELGKEEFRKWYEKYKRGEVTE